MAVQKLKPGGLDAGFDAEIDGIVKRVVRSGPRYHRAAPPVLAIRNFGRSARFGGDGLHRQDGTLSCRWAVELAVEYEHYYKAEDYLHSLTNSALPAATNRIIQHTYLLDTYQIPWAFQAIDRNVPGAVVEPVKSRVKGEMALRYSADGVYDGLAPVLRDKAPSSMASLQANAALLQHSLARGVEPSPVAITSWSQPWSPVWLEWELEATPGKWLSGFNLGQVDFEGTPELFDGKVTLSGRASLTSGIARGYQALIDAYLAAEAQRDEADAGEIASTHEAALAELAEFLTNPDMGSVTLNGLDQFWLGLTDGPDGQVVTNPVLLTDEMREAGLPRILASGRLRLKRARLIDTFGRVRNISTSKTLYPIAYETAGPGSSRALVQPPRLTLPARLMWRFTDPASSTADAAEATLNQQDPSLTVNPVAGFLLPDYIDEAVEFFDASGAALGQILHDGVTGHVVWEGGVGADGSGANLPTEGLEPAARACGLLAQGIIDADTRQRANLDSAGLESALSAFLRAVDTTSWSVEGNLSLSAASVAGLVGRPVALVTARLWLDIPQDLENLAAFGEEGVAIRNHLIAEAVDESLKALEFPIRLGDISKAHDGLYGYFINGDYSQLHLVEQDVAQAARQSQFGRGYRAMLGQADTELGQDFLPAPSPLLNPYISPAERLGLHYGQVVQLTLLMHPYARIHATSGILPRKSLELLRDWVAPGLQQIAPSARIGPVLIDPDRVRLPKIAAYGADQTWVRRDSPITWRNDPILSATQAAILPDGPVSVEEGYIRVKPGPDGGDSI